MINTLKNLKEILYSILKNTQLNLQKEFTDYSYKSTKVNLGQIQSYQNSQKKEISRLSEVEFQVFSQFGDDGIIQWLINKIDFEDKSFVEFGVEKYIESNTRFLLFNNNWRGMVIDGNKENIDYIKGEVVSTFFNLSPICSFITKDNINQIIASKNFTKNLGIISIDIDGNDYWIWECLEAEPILVISEYNAAFGLNHWTIPYKEDFVWDKEKDIYYWGTSLASLCDLSEKKGYSFVGCNSQGNNAYFVRNDKMGGLKKTTYKEGFETAKFSLKRDENNEQFTEKQVSEFLLGKEIFNTQTGRLEIIS